MNKVPVPECLLEYDSSGMFELRDETLKAACAGAGSSAVAGVNTACSQGSGTNVGCLDYATGTNVPCVLIGTANPSSNNNYTCLLTGFDAGNNTVCAWGVGVQASSNGVCLIEEGRSNTACLANPACGSNLVC